MMLLDAIKKSLGDEEYTVTAIMMPKMQLCKKTGRVRCVYLGEATEPGFLIATVDGKFQARVFASAVKHRVPRQWYANWGGNAPTFKGPPKLKVI